MKKFNLFLLFAIFGVASCDLQPKIVALPDTVGEFITSRYPTLLADPKTEPEIYNSAATDYGVYASPELYGASTVDDYVLYSSVDDYIVPPQPEEDNPDEIESSDDFDLDGGDFSSDDVLVVPDGLSDEQEPEAQPAPDDDIAWDENANPDDHLDVPKYDTLEPDEVTVVGGDTLYLLAKKHNVTVQELATANGLSDPYVLRIGQRLRLHPDATSAQKAAAVVKQDSGQVPEVKPKANEKPNDSHKTTTRVDVDTVTVAPGDTLYSLSRRYSVPVNDLAVMNNLNTPFALYAGQQLKVPDLASAPVRTTTKTAPAPKTNTAPAKQPKVSSGVSKQPTPKTVKTEKQTAKPSQDKPKQQTQQKAGQKTAKTTTKTNAKPATQKQPVIAARSSSKFTWPVRGKILSNYGAKNGGLFNDGINISAAAGVTVVAAENGVVAYAGNEVKGMGNLVIIQHSDGWMTVYAHMDSMNVRRGANVKVGQKIGVVGKTGKVDKPQLHFEVRKGTKAYNPIQYLKK